MSFKVEFAVNAKEDIEYFKKSGNKKALEKIYALVNELIENPFEGTGRPELLKHELSGLWSRRINKEHRLVYEVKEDVIFILSTKGHYK
jgi:toxin YoeB